jgi:hypothetical protein
VIRGLVSVTLVEESEFDPEGDVVLFCTNSFSSDEDEPILLLI